jgi:hypothetical protein
MTKAPARVLPEQLRELGIDGKAGASAPSGEREAVPSASASTSASASSSDPPER